MEPSKTYTIGARIDHLSDGVGCFDPIQVVYRMRVVFPQLIEHCRDCLWEAADYFRRFAGSEGALHTAVRDMQERGPKILFEIPLSGGRVISGTAERYWVLVSSEEDFPEDFRRAFTQFLNSLKLQSIEITDE
jgi:hypothetical protein